MYSLEVSKVGNGYRTVCAGGRSVQFYQQDSTLIETVGQHIARSLATGDTAIVIATRQHCLGIADDLSRRGIDVDTLRASQQYVEMDADDTLEEIMVQGWPDAEKFMAVVGRKIARAEALAQEGHVIVFGEMLALLWEQGMYGATVRLEQLWKDFAERYSFFRGKTFYDAGSPIMLGVLFDVMPCDAAA
jgi:hypothetical protein